MGERGRNGDFRLTLWICVAVVLALLLAVILPNVAHSLEIGGEIFLRLLKVIVVPLVFTSVLSGMLSLGDVSKLGRLGFTTLSYYLTTTVIAVLIGLAMVNAMQPGVGAVNPEFVAAHVPTGMGTPKEKITQSLQKSTGLTYQQVSNVLAELPSGESQTPGASLIARNLLLMLVPENLFVAAAEMQLLPIITFAILFGAVLTSMASQVVTLTAVVEQANAALMRFVLALMRVAPLGIFCLVAARFGKAVAEQRLGEELSQIGGYFLTVLLGLAIHSVIVLPLIYWWIIRKNPFAFLGQMSKALMTAFSTASSSATVPITLECAEHSGISKQSREFVIPLGSTVNMDGTALYEAVAAIFIAQAIGFDLTPFNQVVIAVTATLASIGAAGIPEAGLVTMLIVLNAVGLPVEYIGLILSIDWLVDRFRTTVNVWGDCVGAAVVDNTLR